MHVTADLLYHCSMIISIKTYIATVLKLEEFSGGVAVIIVSYQDLITCFLSDNHFVRCDQAFIPKLCYAYVNKSLNYYFKLDSFVADGIRVVDFDILNLYNNFSDHLLYSLDV